MSALLAKGRKKYQFVDANNSPKFDWMATATGPPGCKSLWTYHQHKLTWPKQTMLHSARRLWPSANAAWRYARSRSLPCVVEYFVAPIVVLNMVAIYSMFMQDSRWHDAMPFYAYCLYKPKATKVSKSIVIVQMTFALSNGYARSLHGNQFGKRISLARKNKRPPKSSSLICWFWILPELIVLAPAAGAQTRTLLVLADVLTL